MDNMIKSAPSGLYNMVAHYDRNEINNPRLVTCDFCNGFRYIVNSFCCGEDIIDKKCSKCGDECRPYFEKCESCKGEGEIEL
jgi:DnaJ-class molecular chaperone